MPNQAFQNSLRSKFSASLHSKDRDKFIASLREGATVEDKGYWEETASNIVPSGKKLISETWEMIKHPIQTAKSLYQLGSGVVQLAIPGEQENEDVARAAGQYFADRYGSLEKAKESLKNDPVGVVTEALGVVAGGTGLGKLAVKGAGKVSKVLPEIDTTAMASFPGIKFKDKNLKTAPMKTVDEMAELTASVKVTDDVISNQIKKFNKGKTLKSDKWTEPIYYHGTGADNLKNFSLSVPRYEGGVHGIYLSSDIFEASSYGKNLVTTRLKKDMKVWGGEELPYMGHRNVNKKTGRPDKGTVAKDFNGIKLGIYDDVINKNMLKEYRKIIEKVDNAVLERILDQLHVPGAKKKNIDTAVNLFKEKKQFTSELVGDDPTGVANVMKAGGYDAYLGRQSHIIIFNPKKNIKIEGMADNSNVAIHTTPHWGHTSKYKDVEKAAPIEEAIWSEINTGLQTADMVRLQRTKSNIIKEAYKNSLKSIINQGDLSSTELAGAIKKLRELGVPNLAKGGIPKAATGSIGLEEIKVTHTDGGGGGGRDFSGFRGSGKEYAMNYEPSRGGVEQGGTGSAEKQTEELLKEETPEVEEIVVTGKRDIEDIKFNLFINTNDPGQHGKYDIHNALKSETLKTIKEFTKDNDDVSLTDVYSILFGESSGGQYFHDAAKGPLQIQLDAFIDSQVYQKNYKPVPVKDTPQYDVYMAKAAEDYEALDELGQVNASLNYLEMLNKRFERNNNRKPTIIESATMYNQGYGGAKSYIADPSKYANNKELNTYITNVSEANAGMTMDIPNFEEGGAIAQTSPWGGATGTIYEEPSGPKPLQQQMINAFSEGGISEDKPSLKKKASFAPFLDTVKGALEFAGALTGPIGMASFLGRQIASGEGYSGEPLSGNNTAGMNVTSGNVESGRGTRSATTATPDTIVRQPETEQDYEERVSVYDNSIKEKEDLKKYFKDNFFNPDGGKEAEYDGNKYKEPYVKSLIPEDLLKMDNQEMLDKKLIKVQYGKTLTEKDLANEDPNDKRLFRGPDGNTYKTVTEMYSLRELVQIKEDFMLADNPEDTQKRDIAILALQGLGQESAGLHFGSTAPIEVYDTGTGNAITVKFTSTVEESI